MQPTIQEGEYFACVNMSFDDLEKGHIAVFKRAGNVSFVHRIIWKNKDIFVACGDRQTNRRYDLVNRDDYICAVDLNEKFINEVSIRD